MREGFLDTGTGVLLRYDVFLWNNLKSASAIGRVQVVFLLVVFPQGIFILWVGEFHEHAITLTDATIGAIS